MDFDLILYALPQLVHAAGLSLLFIALGLSIGSVFAVFVALCSVSGNPLLRRTAQAYIFVVRGTPLLVQIFLIYYGLSQFQWVRDSLFWPVLKDPLWCVTIAFVINGGGYIGEVLRGAIQAVPPGQIDAGRAMGMSRATLFRRIILPQAVRIGLPAYGNEVMYTIKDSALASTVTLMEITGTARNLVAKTYKPVEIFLVAACIYLCLVFFAICIEKYIEKKFRIGHLENTLK